MDPEIKKKVLRSFPYGLYGITVHAEERDHGFTANWLTQISFEPPMLALSVEKTALGARLIEEAGGFAVNVFKTGQRELAGKLGRHSENVPDKLAEVPYQKTTAGHPALTDALGWLDCELVGSMDADDHVLFVGEITDAGLLEEGEALTMKETGFRYAG